LDQLIIQQDDSGSHKVSVFAFVDVDISDVIFRSGLCGCEQGRMMEIAFSEDHHYK